MSKFQIIYGACLTAVLNLLLYISAIGEEFVKGGLVAALLIVFAFIVVIKLMLANAVKDGESVDWKAIGSFAIGAAAVTIITIAFSFLAIV